MMAANARMGAVKVPMRGMGRLVGRVERRRRRAIAFSVASRVTSEALSMGYARAVVLRNLTKTHESASIAIWIAQDASSFAADVCRTVDQNIKRLQRLVRAK